MTILPMTGSTIIYFCHSDRENKQAYYDFTSKDAKEKRSKYLE